MTSQELEKLKDIVTRYGDHVLKLDKIIAESAEELEKLKADKVNLISALQELSDDGECYCADYVAAKAVCGHCKAKAVIAQFTPTTP